LETPAQEFHSHAIALLRAQQTRQWLLDVENSREWRSRTSLISAAGSRFRISGIAIAIPAVLLCSRLAIAIPFAATAASGAGQPASPRFDNVRIDALDSEAWNGVVFAASAFGQPSSFALRFGSLSGGIFIDGGAIFDTIREVGPHAPDASYCRVSWQVPPPQPW
jgi:hypothetical protein